MRRKWMLMVTLGVLVVLAGAVGIVAVSAEPDDEQATVRRASGFKPDSLEGKWTGDWKNTTFGSEGSIRANVKVKGEKFIPLVDFGGFVFGCADPDPEKVTLKKGSGKNTWDKKGFKVNKDTEAFGQLEITYKHSNNSFEGEGKKPPCNTDISYTLDGKLTEKKFSADVNINLGGGQKAKAELSAKK